MEENLPSFKYPKLEAKPNEKESDFLRRRLSVYLNIQGFGRGGVQYGQGRAPFGWPSKHIHGVPSKEQLVDVL